MNLKHYKDPHIAVAVAATAVVCSPKARAVLRRGAVYGLAGALRAGDALAAFARGVGRGVQEAAASGAEASGATQPSAAAEIKPESSVASAPARSTETTSNE